MIATNPIARAGAPDLTDDTLVGCWCSPYGNNPWQDVSGRGNTGTPTDTVPENNGAALFNGTTSKISCGTDSSLSPLTEDYTVSAWVKTSNSGLQGVFSKELGGQNNRVAFGVGVSGTAGHQWYFLKDNAGASVQDDFSTTRYDDGAWHYLVWVWDRTAQTLKGYADGAQNGATVSTAALGAFVNAHTAYVGARTGGAANFFVGQLLDVRIYSEAKSTTWIRELYKAGVPR